MTDNTTTAYDAQDAVRLLSAYLPMDRRHALAGGVTLPERCQGSALFADISGFTPLTEALAQALGPRRGMEALLDHLNAVYTALIAEVHRYRGSVIGFAGDAITCWFDEAGTGNGERGADGATPASPLPASAARAVACAFAVQQAMAPYTAIPVPDHEPAMLGIKVAVASGSARRLLAGDPEIQQIDVLAGRTIERMAAGEHLAERGQIVMDAATAAALGEQVEVAAWLAPAESDERHAVAGALRAPCPPCPWPELPPESLDAAGLRAWVPPAAFARIQAGQGEFLAELRPVVAVFVRFTGIDYEGDDRTGEKLDAFIRRVQAVLARHEGTLIQLTLGDKGSYLYGGFGAPVAHEDDARRAVDAALVMRAIQAEAGMSAPLQIGISQGTMRTGACGSYSARTYACIGDETNLAARLMMQAEPGEILVSGRVHKALAATFLVEPRAPVQIKGKSESVPVFSVTGIARRRAIRLQEPVYSLPMIGRAAELQLIEDKLALALQGRGQVVGIAGAAGVGKSRLAAEIIRRARHRGFSGYGGACQADGVNTSYLVWKPIWQAFFDVDPSAPLRRQTRRLEDDLEDMVPERVDALPLLGMVLDLPLPDNDFTRTLNPQLRKSALEALLLDCLAAAAREAGATGGGLLFVLEDLHWLDPASHDLLEQVARACAGLPVLVVLAYRPPEMERLQASRIEDLAHSTVVRLSELDPADAAQIVRSKLAQLWPEWHSTVPAGLIDRLTTRAQGNPFYLEELLNYLHDRGIDPGDAAALETFDLPDSLHRLVLARIDQLPMQRQLTLKVASILGRLFSFSHLCGYYPALGEAARVKRDLDALARLDLTPLDTPEPDLAYLFRHIVTHEVAYATLPHATRAALHEQYARFIEAHAPDPAALLTAPRVDWLAHHYDRSDNLPKKREYLHHAGRAAAARFANVEAVEYFSRALALAPEDDRAARFELLMEREQVLGLQAQRAAQAQDLAALEALVEAEAAGRPQEPERAHRRALVALRRAAYAESTSDYAATIASARQAIDLARIAGAVECEAHGHMLWGRALWRQADYPAAHPHATEALALARAAGARKLEADILIDLGSIAKEYYEDPENTQAYFSQSLQICREIGDRVGENRAIGNLGNAATTRRDFAGAQTYYEQGLRLARSTGNRWSECFELSNLGLVILALGRYTEALPLFEQALQLSHAIGCHVIEIQSAGSLGETSDELGAYSAAHNYIEQALQASRATGKRRLECAALYFLSRVEHHRGDHAAARAYAEQAVELAQALGIRGTVAAALTHLGDALSGLGEWEPAAAAYRQALDLHRELNDTVSMPEPLAGLARAALAGGAADLAHAHALELYERIVQVDPERGEIGLEPYLICYRVLHASGDPRARDILAAGHAILERRAARIDAPHLRRSFLENVAVNRELTAAWRQADA